MKIKSKHYAKALFETLSEIKGNDQLKKQIKKFVELLIKNNQISELNRIIDHFENIWNEKKGVVKAEIVSAHELEKDTVKAILDYIKNDTEAKEIEIKERVDKSIVGGVIIRKGSKVLDQSLSIRLHRINEIMNK